MNIDEQTTAAIDALVDAEVEASVAPALALAVVEGGTVVHSVCRGTVGSRSAVTSGTRFRIASMTKSFTAVMVLALRDQGRIALDEPIARYIPALASLRPPTDDSRPVTVRQLLTMSAGLATDDPWADRHLGDTPAEMDSLFASGATFAAAPGYRFDYSNYAFAMLGRLIEVLTGGSCSAAISSHVLAPLGLHHTTWDVGADLRAANCVAEPFRVVDRTALDEGTPPLPDGGFAPMGGLWSTTSDLARWTAFFCDAFPPRDGADPYAAVLSRASRREMQQVHNAQMPPPLSRDVDGRLRQITLGYGMGLNVAHHVDAGPVVSHSGGLPGYGSHMRWLPNADIAIVALANVTYGPMRMLSSAVLEALVDGGVVSGHVEQHDESLVRAAAQSLAELLSAWDDDIAIRLFADNVLLDEPIEIHRRRAAELVAAHGQLRVAAIHALSRTEADVVLAGDCGSVQLELQLGSMTPPLVQWYEVQSLQEAT